jgi:hypothetical protein
MPRPINTPSTNSSPDPAATSPGKKAHCQPSGRGQARRLPVHRGQGQPARPVRRARCSGLGEHARFAHCPGPRAWPGRDPHHPGSACPPGLVPPRRPRAFLIERTVRDPHDGQLRSAAAALGITSRAVSRGGAPEAIAVAARGHWDIEALHHVRDVTLDEDAQRLRAGTSAQVMATLRNTAIAVLRLAGFTSTVSGRRWAARNPARSVAALCLI